MSSATLDAGRTPGLLPGGPGGLDAHVARYGPLPGPARAELVDTLRAAGLTGHGGAGFPTWRKIDALGSRPVVIANGAEGEPASGKDATLLRHNPHLVLDGLQIVASAVGSVRAVLASTKSRLAGVPAAVEERRADVEVVEVPDRFLSGQESALAAAVDGRPALPTGGPVRVSTSGVDGRPTLVLNVETLALVALVARRGAAWYRSQGSPDDPGLFLATVTGAVNAPGVVQAAYGTRLDELIATTGGASTRVGAVLLGGYHGTWLTGADVGGLALAPRRLGERGAALGAGVIVVHPHDRCGLTATAAIASWLAEQSAAQCGPCLNGLPRLAGALQAFADGQGGADALQAVRRYASLADGRGACRHPDGTVRLVGSALLAFGDDVDAHLSGRCLQEGS